jgi:hypothetical protein
MPEPIDHHLYEKARSSANRKFGAKTSLYKSSYMVHEYLKMGGRYRGKKDPHHGLVSAFSKLRKSRKNKTVKRRINRN